MTDALPDFRSLGVVLRVLLLGNLAGFAGALVLATDATGLLQHFAEIAAVLEPVLALSLTLLYAISKLLARLPYVPGALIVAACNALGTLLVLRASEVTGEFISAYGAARAVLLSVLLTALLLAYFFWRRRAYSPALSGARLQALQARIRPHFLFNSITAVLSLIRSDNKRAEEALEDMAELYRALMQDNRELTTLDEELLLCQQYLRLEQLRLGERLVLNWDIANMPGNALVPRLLLQPLVENAIYHGIEPQVEPGAVNIVLRREGNQVRIRIVHPYLPAQQHRAGNRTALANMRERLALHYDVEASLEAKVTDDRFEIDITIPYRKKT